MSLKTPRQVSILSNNGSVAKSDLQMERSQDAGHSPLHSDLDPSPASSSGFGTHAIGAIPMKEYEKLIARFKLRPRPIRAFAAAA